MNAIAYMLVTPSKTLLEHTQTPTLMEIIRTILEHVLYVGITLPLIISLLATIITDTKQLRAWAKGQRGEGEEGPQDPQKESQNPVKGDHI